MIDTEKIKQTMLRKGITTQMMCKELRLPYYALIMILDKNYPPTWEDLCRIANVIGCNVIDLIVKEGEHEQGCDSIDESSEKVPEAEAVLE